MEKIIIRYDRPVWLEVDFEYDRADPHSGYPEKLDISDVRLSNAEVKRLKEGLVEAVLERKGTLWDNGQLWEMLLKKN